MYSKILIIGYARHGKDTIAEIFRDHFGMTFVSSSIAACRIAIYPTLRERYGYTSIEECYQDRVNHRQEWYDLISDYNSEDGSKLCKKILFGTIPLGGEPFPPNDCYVGMRSKREFEASKWMFSLIIFVDASERHPIEGRESCTNSPKDADIIITNNGSLEEFKEKVIRLGKMIF